MFCINCGKELPENVKFCPECGQQVGNIPSPVQQSIIMKKEREPKSQFVAILLCLFLGALGIHDFYLNRNTTGVVKLIIAFLGLLTSGATFIISFVWCLIDFIIILCKGFDELLTNEEIKLKEEKEEAYKKEEEVYKKEYEARKKELQGL